MLTLIPARLTVWVTRTASAISVPATKRPETRRPIADRSAKLRRERFSESWTKNALSMKYLPGREEGVKECPQFGGRPQKFVSQTGDAADTSRNPNDVVDWNYLPCSSRNFSTSMAAMQPVPAAVMAWR